MIDKSKTKYQVKRNGFDAQIGRWADLRDGKASYTCQVGSCSVPPLGTAEAMTQYEIFIETVINVCSWLNRLETLNESEIAYIERYTK